MKTRKMRLTCLMATVALLALVLSANLVFATAETQAAPDEGLQVNPMLAELGLDNPAALDESGTVVLPEDGSLLDIRLPERLGEEQLTTIGENAFAGTDCLRSVTIPSSITAIGKDAFADCPNLQYIVLEGRADTEGLTLGENWNGSATVIFGLVKAENNEYTVAPDATVSDIPTSQDPESASPSVQEPDAVSGEPAADAAAPEVTVEPTTQAPSTEEPTVEEPSAEEPTAEESSAEESVEETVSEETAPDVTVSDETLPAA